MVNKILNKIKPEGIIAIGFFLAFCIYFIPSPNHAIRVHDTFDGNFTSRHVLIHSGHFFDTNPTTIVPGIMNGLPRGVFTSFTELNGLLMYFFGSLSGFALAFLIVRFIGFLGLYLLGRDHLQVKEEQKGLLILVSVAFACLPVFVIQGLTVTGIPFVLWAFFNLLKRQKMKLSLLVFLIFGLWSQLVLVGFHIILVLGILAVYYSIKIKKIQWPLFNALIILGFTYLASNYMLFYLHGVDTSYHSSREGFEKELSLNLNGVIGGTFRSFFEGDYSTANYFGYLFLPFIFYYIYTVVKEYKAEQAKMGIVIILIILFSAFMINLLDWKGFAFFYKYVPFAKLFNFKRFTNLLPGFFFVLVLLAILKTTVNQKKIHHAVSVLALLVLFVFIWRGNISYNNSGFNNAGVKIERDEETTFNEFFDPPFYSQLKKEMGVDSVTNLIHFGMSPSGSKYAKISVLDDYQGDYPSAYKAEFRKIIEGELNKSANLKTYFDNWGARCYLYSSNEFENKLDKKFGLDYETNLSINTKQLKLMNCKFVLSAIIIGNAGAIGLKLKKIFVNELTYRKYLLYCVI